MSNHILISLCTDCTVPGYTFEESLNFCYKISTFTATWDQASSYCNSDGGHLVLLESQALNDYLMLQLDFGKDLHSCAYFNQTKNVLSLF